MFLQLDPLGNQFHAARGIYVFTAEDAIAFQLPRYSGTAKIELRNDDRLTLTVTTSEAPFGIIYSAQRAK